MRRFLNQSGWKVLLDPKKRISQQTTCFCQSDSVTWDKHPQLLQDHKSFLEPEPAWRPCRLWPESLKPVQLKHLWPWIGLSVGHVSIRPNLASGFLHNHISNISHTPYVYSTSITALWKWSIRITWPKKKTCTAQMLESAMELWRHSGQFSNFQACLVKATTSLVLLKYAVLLMVLCKEPVVVLFQTIKPGCQAVKLVKWDRLTAGCMVKQAFLDKRLTATPNRSI